jgi:uncharacterized sulfatase
MYTDELYDLEADPAELVNLIEHPDYVGIRTELHDQLLVRMDEVMDTFRGPVWERRLWRKTYRYPRSRWHRPRPADGYAPPMKIYETGLPEDVTGE